MGSIHRGAVARRLLTVAFSAAMITACVPDPGTDPGTGSTTTTTSTTTTAPLPSTMLEFRSEPGDYIGGGVTRRWTPADGSFTISGGGSKVDVSFIAPGYSVWWYLDFAAPIGKQLVPGPFEGATRYPFQSPMAPGLDVSGDGRGCNRSTGRFDIRQADTDANGNLIRFAADFEQRCDSSTGKLRGTIRWNATDPYPAVVDTDGDGVADTVDNCRTVGNASQSDADRDAAGDACDSIVNNTKLAYQSDTGDYIGQGLTRSYYPMNGTFATTGSADRRSLSLSYDGGNDNWTLNLRAPSALAVGTYTGATRYPFEAAGVPGLSFGGSGRGCNTLTGTYTINELVWGSGNVPTKLSVDFEQHCEGGAPALRGQVRYNATTL